MNEFGYRGVINFPPSQEFHLEDSAKLSSFVFMSFYGPTWFKLNKMWANFDPPLTVRIRFQKHFGSKSRLEKLLLLFFSLISLSQFFWKKKKEWHRAESSSFSSASASIYSAAAAALPAIVRQEKARPLGSSVKAPDSLVQASNSAGTAKNSHIPAARPLLVECLLPPPEELHAAHAPVQPTKSSSGLKSNA